MPKVDPETGQPMSDDPDQADPAVAGGKVAGDPGTMQGDGAGEPSTVDQPSSPGHASGPDGPR